MIIDNIYTVEDVAEFLGIGKQSVYKLIHRGDLDFWKLGKNYVFMQEDVEACRQKFYADGLSHRDIARIYGRKRTNVAYHYKRLKVRHIGLDRRSKGAKTKVYSRETVEKFALVLGWMPVGVKVG